MIKNKSKQTNMKLILKSITLAALGLSLLASCKKDNKEEPDLTVIRSDTVFLGATKTQDTINVLLNDDLFDLKSLYINYSSSNMAPTFTLYKDSSFTVKTSPYFYGTQETKYIVTDKNGQKQGSLIIDRGTPAQKMSYSVLTNIAGRFLRIYAIDGDTAGLYWGFYSYGVYTSRTQNQFNLLSVDIPQISVNAPETSVGRFETILANGTFHCKESFTDKDVFFTIEEGFSAQAKTRDGKRVVTVTGVTVGYNSHVLNYIYYLPEN